MSAIVRFHIFVGKKCIEAYAKEDAARTWVRVYNGGRATPEARLVKVTLPEPREEECALYYT
jgi:hypothetical protein